MTIRAAAQDAVEWMSTTFDLANDEQTLDLLHKADEELLATLREPLYDRISELIEHVDEPVWRQLLGRCPKEARGAVLKKLGLPAVRGRVTDRLVADVTTRIRQGVMRHSEPVGIALHDLTKPLRGQMWQQVLSGQTRPADDAVDSVARAVAVALCPASQPMFLPIVLTWLSMWDPKALGMLLVGPEPKQALDDFWAAAGLNLSQAVSRLPSERADEPDHSDVAQPETILTHGEDDHLTSTQVVEDPTNSSAVMLEPVMSLRPTTSTPAPARTESQLAVPQSFTPLQKPAALAALAHAAVQTAVASCSQTLDRLSAGQVPTAAALADLATARTVLLETAAALGSRLQRELDPTLNAIDEAVYELTQFDVAWSQLEALVRAEAPARAQEALQAAISQARKLLDSWPPTSVEQIAAAHLLSDIAALARDAADGRDDDEIDDRYETLQRGVPEQMAPLLLAAVRGRIGIPSTAIDVAAPQSTAEPKVAKTFASAHAAPAKPAVTTSAEDTAATDTGDTAVTGNAAPAADSTPAVASRSAEGSVPNGETPPAADDASSTRPHSDKPSAASTGPAADKSIDPFAQTSTFTSAGTSGRRTATPLLVPSQPTGRAVAPVTAASPTSTPVSTLAAAPEPATIDLAALTDKAACWIRTGQYALAAHLLRPHLPAVAAAAELAALAAAATGPSGPHEHELNARATDGQVDQLVDGDAARLLTTGATLLATAVTGSTVLGNLLVDLSDRMDSAAAALARPLGDTARGGHFAGRGMTALTRVAADQADVVHAATQAAERTRTHRASRLPRAAAVLSRLRRPIDDTTDEPQTLGGALHAAADDQRQHLDAINAIVSRLSKPSALDRLIDDDDMAHRPPNGKPIEGTVRQEMVSTLREDLAAIARWAAAVQQHAPSSPDYVRTQLTTLRETLLTRQDTLQALLASRTSDTNPLTAAAATAAASQVQRLVQLVDGHGGLVSSETDPQETLDLPLLTLAQAGWDPIAGIQLEPPLDTDSAALSTALLAVPDSGLDLLHAAKQHSDRDDYRTARHLLQRLSGPHCIERLTALDEAQRRRVEQLREQLSTVQRHLSRLRLADPDSAPVASNGITLDAVTEDQLTRRLGRAISLLDEDEPDVRAAALTASGVDTELDQLHEHNRARLRTHLAELQTGSTVADEDLDRVERRIAEGMFDLAADDLTRLAAGETLFEPAEDDLFSQFHPAIASLFNGIDAALLNAVLKGTRHPFLPVRPLPEGIRDDVHAGLNGWRSVGDAFVSGWQRDLARDNLLPALRLVGLDARGAQVDQLDGKSFAYARGRRFLDLKGATVTGKALVPAFGSAAQGRYRLLLVWNDPTVEQLDEWRDSDASHLPLIVCYFGTMQMADRLALGARWADPSRRPAIVLDNAILAWIATRRGTFEMFMRLTLPFTATQPFRREKRADVPPEMFYGRARERRQLMNPNGPSVVYGGRGLGKSALLYTIEHDADASVDDDLAVVWIEVDRISGIGEDPDLLWGELADKLKSKGVTAGPRSSRSNPKDRVAKAVKSWTDQPGKRVLILLDEAEGFFNGDAPQFAHVRRLYQLSSETQFECKVVFSGLHSVQHYYAAGNIPFSPTGHLQIGPLTSQSAYQLLTLPLASLGYTLGEDDAQRILLHCNYQPWLIQLVAEKLLATQLDRRANGKTALPLPPWTISTADVLAALNEPTTRGDVRAALGLTLDIDKRTRVITSVLALYAYDNPPGARMPDTDLYTECGTAWPSGFANTTLVAFRELLSELAGLGILADTTDDSTGRAIHNETVLRALGSRKEAERHLHEVALSALEVNEARGQTRPPRTDGARRNPLTTAQLGQLFRKGNRTRIIVGTTATGIGQVADSLYEVAPQMVTVERPTTGGAYRAQLEAGATDAQRLLVVSDLTSMSTVKPCENALTLAIGDESGAGLPRNPGASRTVALLAGQDNVDWLLELTARPDTDELVMPLERYNKYTLPLRWRGEGGLDVFADGQMAHEVLAATDGWPQLVEKLAVDAARRRGRTAQPADALEQLRAEHADPAWCRAFLTASGALLPSWPEMARLIEVLVEYEEPCSLKDVQLLAADKVTDLLRTVQLAQWFGLVTLTENVQFALSPLIAACCRTTGLAAA